MRAVVTGSGGFIGGALAAHLGEVTRLHLGAPDWEESLARTDFGETVVFHLAARVHDARADAAAWVRDNVEKTEALAQRAASAGASRLVFISTIKVHGDETTRRPFEPTDPFDPGDDYARSKQLAEERLQSVSRNSGLPVVVVRPPLVFGARAKANLDEVVRLAASGLPLPFAAVSNRRSWIHVDDLCALLVACANHPGAAGRAFIACHDRPFSTPELLGGLRERLRQPRRLFAMPRALLEGLSAIAGQGSRMKRLTRSLEGSGALARELLGWEARKPLSVALDDLVQGTRAS